ncbi:ATP-binding protein [Anaeroselena agilis]|uniref:histidine kinase n=1 Tax=Anaeroselena agilis TaxID=3063788 RepID=A0ABU3NSU3_9FIRM|nr:ATP-binding protein [Selenomonadales bacterium 4137-cl]
MRKVSIREAFGGASPALRNLSLGIVLFGIFMVFAVFLAYYNAIQGERQEEMRAAVKETANLARAFEEHTLRTLMSADQATLFLKYHYEREGKSIDIPGYIRDGRLPGEPFIIMGVIDENGDLVASSQVPLVTANFSDREHFRVHVNRDSEQLHIGKPVLGRVSGRWAIQMTRRVNKPDGSFGGVAVVAVDPYYFSDFYRQVDLGQNSAVVLVGRDGIVRARQAGSSTVAGQDLTGTELMNKLVDSDAGSYVATREEDGVTRLYSYRALLSYPVAVAVGIDRQEILQRAGGRSTHYYPVAGLICLGILVCVLLLLRFVARYKAYDEDLRSARALLEARVEERTRELSALNEELKAMNEEHLAMNEELQSTNRELWDEVGMRRRTEVELKHRNEELAEAYAELNTIQLQAYQQDKMASIGQLAAGVAHEINNPMSFIISNLESLNDYLGRLTRFIKLQEETVSELTGTHAGEGVQEDRLAVVGRLEAARQSLKVDYVIHDVESLINETFEGAGRVKDIVQDLKGFARVESESRLANINEGVESAINIVWNEMKYKASLDRDYGELPLTKCNIGQLNQVFMNVLVNATQAIDKWGEIKVKTWADGGKIYISITDTGCGIPPQLLNRIFEPFFTTKEVGKGTGLGLSVTYDIVKRHGGEIRVTSESGQGTTFTIIIPVTE